MINTGVPLDRDMAADIKEFEVTNQLRLSGIVSAKPLPRILYPDYKIYEVSESKVLIELSFQHHTIIYQKLADRHHRLTFKEWFVNLYDAGIINRLDL